MGDYSGFATLGDIVTGGASHDAQAKYPKYLAEAAGGYKALDQAAEERAKRLARDAVGARYRAWAAAQGLSPEAADLGAAYATGGDMNFNTQMGGSGKLADMEIDRQITQALASGDTKKAQQLSAVKTDKVLPTVEAAGKVVFTPVTGEATMTSLGDAAIGAEQALEAARHASAARSGRVPAAKPARSDQRRQELADIEADLGHPLTEQERTEYLLNGRVNFKGKPVRATEEVIDTTGPTDRVVVPEHPVSLADVAPAPGYVNFDDIPDAAKAKLKEGVKTRFGNGQVWTLVRGHPTRVQ